MKIIKPEVDILAEENPLKRIERVARVCWGTENKITENSAMPFCERLLKMGHTSPFEHARIFVPMLEYEEYARCHTHAPYGFFNRHKISLRNGVACIVINCRDYIALGGKLDKLESYPLADDFITVKFIIDIGVGRELLRHRQMSFMERSTRYVNMKNGIDFILPLPFDWAGSDDIKQDETILDDRFADPRYQAWFFLCETAEYEYKKLLSEGCSPQEARSVLPLSTATVLYVTGMYEQWRDLLALRTEKSAHPQMQYAMKLLLQHNSCPAVLK